MNKEDWYETTNPIMSVNKAMHIHVQTLISYYKQNQYNDISSAKSLASSTIVFIIKSRVDACKTARSNVMKLYTYI
jgi:hypothetical protein